MNLGLTPLYLVAALLLLSACGKSAREDAHNCEEWQPYWLYQHTDKGLIRFSVDVCIKFKEGSL